MKLSSIETSNLALGIVGILLSGCGFIVTLYQVRKTRTAVEASNLATRQAFQAISTRVTISEVADMRSGLKGLQTALRGQRYEAAVIQLQGILDQLHALRSRPGFQTEERHARIQGIVVQLAKLRNKVEAKIDDSSLDLSTPKANNMLAEIGNSLSTWAEQLRSEEVRHDT